MGYGHCVLAEYAETLFFPRLERFERLERLEPATCSIRLSNFVIYASLSVRGGLYALRTLLSTIHSGPRRVC